MINPKLKKLLDVMRSPENTNTIGVYGHYKVGEEFCAVGFILEQYRLKGSKSNKSEWQTAYLLHGDKPVQVLTPEDAERRVEKYFGVSYDTKRAIIRANDQERRTFGQIADMIEQLVIED